jgi:hypothetical protein
MSNARSPLFPPRCVNRQACRAGEIDFFVLLHFSLTRGTTQTQVDTRISHNHNFKGGSISK